MRVLELMAHGWPVHQVMGMQNLRLNKLFDVLLGRWGGAGNKKQCVRDRTSRNPGAAPRLDLSLFDSFPLLSLSVSATYSCSCPYSCPCPCPPASRSFCVPDRGLRGE